METRTILQIVLGVIFSAVALVGVLIVYELTRSPETMIIEKTFQKEKEEKKEEKNKWEDREKKAIELVKAMEVGEMSEDTREMFGLSEDKEEDEERPTVGKALENDEFVKKLLKLDTPEPKGWQAEWWGQTKYGAYFYLVKYGFQDANITVGPTWLVSLKDEKVVPKNVTAKVATNPEGSVESEYYDKADEVVEAMIKHTFESGHTLAGTLLVYFERRADSKEDDTILGWTIQHDRDEIFKAYFQWLEGNEPTYAEFEFDYDRKALKAVNLHAGNIMRVGETFEETEPVDILPKSFNPEADRESDQWTGAAAKAYAKRKFRDRFRALGTVLNETDLIGSIEWMLRAQAKTAEQFEQCKKKRKCRWKPKEKESDVYRVTYIYNLGSGDKKIQWDVDLNKDADKISPVGRVSKLAFRVVHPRE